MLIPTATSSLVPMVTGALVDSMPGMSTTNNTTSSSETNETSNTNISTDNSTNTSGMNALSMFLFWFFIISTIFLVLGSLAVLRRLKRRDKKLLQEHKASKAARQAKGYFGIARDTSESREAHSAAKDVDEESSIGDSTISLLPIAKAHARTQG
ncbi:hypothetical protein F503_03544 [Ophiostoma piceae UAMH 11346]|uniref:Uncharacterized protein n=1 Tax=Ophiostoma piceae (strain UAMH 11346) TaxID=1262450 RepID=S3BVB2_OPHP1|nr:hypothetical protein F503_03544 [Ophiostoma piceae UAMH 11346]